MARLGVVIDGEALDEASATAFWKRFSAHMEAHRGDLAGFAKSEGLASVKPAVGAEGPELHASRSAPQGPYTTAERLRSRNEPSKIQGKGGSTPRRNEKGRRSR
jgi:hypothetical protein